MKLMGLKKLKLSKMDGDVISQWFHGSRASVELWVYAGGC